MRRRVVIGLALALLAGPRARAADAPIGGLSYSPSGIVAFADFAKGIDEAHLRRDLAQLRPLTRELRIYAAAWGMERFPALAAEYAALKHQLEGHRHLFGRMAPWFYREA